MAIIQRGMMIQHMVNTFYYRHTPEELREPLSTDELARERRILNERWRTAGDMEVDEAMVREARERALQQKEREQRSAETTRGQC